MTLAQSTLEIAPLLFPVLVGMIGIGLLIGLAIAVRKKILKMNEDDGTELAAGFSMGSLRQLVRDGKMTQEEFDAAKARIVAGTQREIDKDAAAKKSLSDVVAARRGEPAAAPPDAEIVEHKPPTDERR
jgi:hypothetical protein